MSEDDVNSYDTELTESNQGDSDEDDDEDGEDEEEDAEGVISSATPHQLEWEDAETRWEKVPTELETVDEDAEEAAMTTENENETQKLDLTTV